MIEKVIIVSEECKFFSRFLTKVPDTCIHVFSTQSV